MALEPLSSAAFDFLARVALTYRDLLDTPRANPVTGLGGRLFYAGQLDNEARALVVAANIAGAATLVATADSALQKQAMRDGVVDFVVTTLDEALRILKNQLRKQETVAICVAQPRADVEREMNERGVAPDLLRDDIHFASHHEALLFSDGQERETDLRKIPALVCWSAGSTIPKDLALLDEIALSCLDAGEWQSRRWLRLSPRYLGRMAQGLRVLDADRDFVARFIDRVRQSIECGESAATVDICSYFRGLRDEQRFSPTKQ